MPLSLAVIYKFIYYDQKTQVLGFYSYNVIQSKFGYNILRKFLEGMVAKDDKLVILKANNFYLKAKYL